MKAAGWGVVEGTRVLCEHGITLGRLQGSCGKGARAKAEVADNVLVYRNTKLAVIGAGRDRILLTLATGTGKTFWSADGRPMSAAPILQVLYGALPQFFLDEDELRRIWSAPHTHKALLAGLADKGFGRDPLTEIQKVIEAEPAICSTCWPTRPLRPSRSRVPNAPVPRRRPR